MAVPIPRSIEERLRALRKDVDRLMKHSHPGVVSQPVTIEGDVSDPATLAALLAALNAAGIIIDETT